MDTTEQRISKAREEFDEYVIAIQELARHEREGDLVEFVAEKYPDFVDEQGVKNEELLMYLAKGYEQEAMMILNNIKFNTLGSTSGHDLN